MILAHTILAKRQQTDIPLVVLGLAFSFKAVDLVHVIRLVVTTIQEEAIGAQPFVSVE